MNGEIKKACSVCNVRSATCFERVCNNCMCEMHSVVAGRYSAATAAYRIGAVTVALARTEEENYCRTQSVQTTARGASGCLLQSN